MIEKELEILKTIKPAAVNPFLFTRIEEKIRAGVGDYLSTRKTVLYLAGIVMILMINIWMILGQKNESRQNLASEMELVETNQLYE